MTFCKGNRERKSPATGNSTAILFTVLLCLSLGLLPGSATGLESGEKAGEHHDEIVEVKGIVGMGVDRTAAMNDAFRMAIVKGKGMCLWARTLVSDAITLSDTVETMVNGIVEDFEVLDEARTEDGEYQVSITAKVHLKEVSRLSESAAGSILRRSGNPRVVILSAEKVRVPDGVVLHEEWKVTADYLKEKLIENNFYVLEEGDWTEGHKQLNVLAGQYVDKVVSLGRSHDADIVIFLNAEAKHKGMSDLERVYGTTGLSTHTWESRVKAEAVFVHEQRVIALEKGTSKKTGRDAEEILELSLKEAIDELADDFITKILLRLNYYINNGFTIQVTVVGDVRGERINLFHEVMNHLPGVQQVDIKKGAARQGFLADVICTYNAGCLSKVAELKLKALGFLLEEITLNRLVYRALRAY